MICQIRSFGLQILRKATARAYIIEKRIIEEL